MTHMTNNAKICYTGKRFFPKAIQSIGQLWLVVMFSHSIPVGKKGYFEVFQEKSLYTGKPNIYMTL